MLSMTRQAMMTVMMAGQTDNGEEVVVVVMVVEAEA